MPTIKKINLNGTSYDIGGGLTEDVKQGEYDIGGGLTEDVKQGLLNFAEKAAYSGEDYGDQVYDELYNAFYNNTWAISATLSNASLSNPVESIEKGESYTTIISASTGYTLDGATVQVTMGGANVTSAVYSNGVVNIPAVTSDVVITVVAVALTVVSISAVYTQSGTVYDTDTLDSLKADLAVTATFNDSSTEVVPSADYTLTGTLEAGTSTITVSYSGKTTTFSVTVTRLEIRVFRGKGVSGTTIVDNAKRALSEPVAFSNVAPITLNWPSLSAFRLVFKNTTTDINTIDTTSMSVAPIAYLNEPRPSASDLTIDGWLIRTGEEFLTGTTAVGETLTPITFSRSSGYARLLFANVSNLSNSLPAELIDSVFYINGIPYHLIETPISEFE